MRRLPSLARTGCSRCSPPRRSPSWRSAGWWRRTSGSPLKRLASSTIGSAKGSISSTTCSSRPARYGASCSTRFTPRTPTASSSTSISRDPPKPGSGSCWKAALRSCRPTEPGPRANPSRRRGPTTCRRATRWWASFSRGAPRGGGPRRTGRDRAVQSRAQRHRGSQGQLRGRRRGPGRSRACPMRRARPGAWDLIVLSALLLVAIGVFLVKRRASLEAGLRVKTDFLTTMSHELRTPLTGVIGITDLLQTASIPRPSATWCGCCRTNATTLLALINNVLDYSRIDARADDAVAAALPAPCAGRRSAGRGQRGGLAQGSRARLCDRRRRRRRHRRRGPRAAGALNLLSNAVKYTERGEIAIRVSAAPESHGVVGRDHRRSRHRNRDPRRPAAASLPVVQPDRAGGAQQVGGTGLWTRAISDRLSRLLGGSDRSDKPAR